MTFEVRKQNLKDITILKDNNTVCFNDFFSKTVNDDKVIYHDYQQSQETLNKEYEGVKIADPNKDNYIIRVILNNDDFTPIFNKKILETNYPQISRWELVDTFPSLTDEYGVIIKEKNIYNAYKSNNEKGEWEQCSYNVPYTLELKPNFDIIITLYDRNNTRPITIASVMTSHWICLANTGTYQDWDFCLMKKKLSAKTTTITRKPIPHLMIGQQRMITITNKG